MAQQGTQRTKRRKGMVSTVLLIIAAFLLLFLPGYLARIFGDDSEGKYKYCTVEKAWAEYRAGGDTGGNNDYTRVGRIETRECGKLALSESRIRINQWMIIWPPLNREGITRCT